MYYLLLPVTDFLLLIQQACIKLEIYLIYFSSSAGIVSLWSLTILAFERYNVVCEPVGALKLSTQRGYQGLTFIWLFCLIWAVAPLLGWSSYGPEGVQTSCSIGWEERSWSNYSYLITYFLTCFVIPVAIIGFSYGSILSSLHKVYFITLFY